MRKELSFPRSGMGMHTFVWNWFALAFWLGLHSWLWQVERSVCIPTEDRGNEGKLKWYLLNHLNP